jgi:hypothetical protein
VIFQIVLATAAIISAVESLPAQRPAAFETPVVGTSGGAPFVDRCLAHEVMAGVSARLTGGELTGVGIICRLVSDDGALGPSQPPHVLHGAAVGTPAVAECPRGQVLRGLAVYFVDAVRGIGLYCRVWEGAVFGAAGAASETVGMATGTMSPVTCPPDGAQPAVGVGGAVGTRVVAVRLLCDLPRR